MPKRSSREGSLRDGKTGGTDQGTASGSAPGTSVDDV